VVPVIETPKWVKCQYKIIASSLYSVAAYLLLLFSCCIVLKI
jgi:hypothetical protein